MNPNVTAQVLFDTAKSDLKNCQKITDFVTLYDSPAYQTMLARMRQSLTASGLDSDTWAREWAVRMRTAIDGPDIDLNSYRKCVLYLLYELCDAWKDEQNASVTAESIVKVFQGHRVENILLLALPIDRAQCLYNMKYPKATEYGMHWVSSAHFASEPAEHWEEELQDRDGRTTMNKRLLWLGDLAGLEFGSADIGRWLKSARCENYMH